METDTIAAIATAAGNSGISIVRISGENAIEIADKIFFANNGRPLKNCKSHTLHYGIVKDQEKMLDEVLVSVMRKPKSYTMENTVEINCHGGALVTRKVLETVIKAGARPAQPGEFTKRAFLNGRMDLSQAEAVMDVINAKNTYALQAFVEQLKGSVHKKISRLRSEILYQVAFIEAVLDDPEHLSFQENEDFYGKMEAVKKELEQLIHSFENGRILREGIRTVILGKPNVGKSSLLNVLAGQERAIVTEIPGTTRDILEETVMIGGLSLIVTDTAGIHRSEDKVEQIGIQRAKKCAEQADLVLYVADASKEMDENDKEILMLLENKKTIVLLNKSDLPQVITEQQIRSVCGFPVILISAKEEKGISLLEKTLQQMFFEGDLSANEEVYITNIRQKTALVEAEKSMELVLESIRAGMPEDFYTIDLMNAYEALGTVIGESVGEDLVNEIFGKFCVGK